MYKKKKKKKKNDWKSIMKNLMHKNQFWGDNLGIWTGELEEQQRKGTRDKVGLKRMVLGHRYWGKRMNLNRMAFGQGDCWIG